MIGACHQKLLSLYRVQLIQLIKMCLDSREYEDLGIAKHNRTTSNQNRLGPLGLS